MNKNIFRSTFHSQDDKVKIVRSKATMASTSKESSTESGAPMFWQDPTAMIAKKSLELNDKLN